MSSDLVVLGSADVLEDVIVTSEERLVLLFKHSVTCGTSAQAYDELVDHLSTGQHTTQYVIVTVQTHRDLSDAVAARFKVRHETPQTLLIHKGQVVWEASHFSVTTESIKAAIDRYAPNRSMA
jgi:bacillithiol system protein YtxJ